MAPVIKRNIIRCLSCNDMLESRHRYDYRSCGCGSVSIDGGMDYLRRSFPSGNPEDWYEELSEYIASDTDDDFIG